MKLHGAWAFGWALDLHVVDEPVKKDSAFVIETIALALEKVIGTQHALTHCDMQHLTANGFPWRKWFPPSVSCVLGFVLVLLVQSGVHCY